MKLIFLLFFLAGCTQKLLPLKYGPSSIGSVQLQISKEVLNNGLTVILVENRKLPLFSFYSFVKVGSRHEMAGMTGASHYLEHLMFKGSKNYAAGDFEKIVIGNGGIHNAYTTRDLTVYHESLPINALDKILDLEADRLFYLSMEKQSFEREREVILEERKYRTENSPQGLLFLEIFKASYKGTPYAHPPIGSMVDIETVTPQKIREHFETFYDPANIVIVLSGDFNSKELMKKMHTKFANAPSRGKLTQSVRKRDQLQHYAFKTSWKSPRTIEVHGNSPLAMFMLTYPSFPKGHEKSFAMDILTNILGGGQSSYFAQKYIYGSRPLLGQFYAYNHDVQKSGLLVFGGQLLKGKSLSAFRNRLRKDLKRLCDQAVSDRKVEKVKNQYLVGYFSSFETNGGLAELVGMREVYYGDPWYFKRELEDFLKVKSDEVRDVCKEIVEKNSPLIISLWNKHKKVRRRR